MWMNLHANYAGGLGSYIPSFNQESLIILGLFPVNVPKANLKRLGYYGCAKIVGI